MHGTVKLSNSERGDIPALQPITNYDSSLNQTKKKEEKDGIDVNKVIGDGTPKKSGRNEMMDAYAIIIERIGKENSNVNPKFGFLLFQKEVSKMSKVGLAVSEPVTEYQVKAKISTLKRVASGQSNQEHDII